MRCRSLYPVWTRWFHMIDSHRILVPFSIALTSSIFTTKDLCFYPMFLIRWLASCKEVESYLRWRQKYSILRTWKDIWSTSYFIFVFVFVCVEDGRPCCELGRGSREHFTLFSCLWRWFNLPWIHYKAILHPFFLISEWKLNCMCNNAISVCDNNNSPI